MKKINTDSYFVTIYELKNKKIVRRRKRKGLHAYPRTISLENINKILNQTSLHFPRIYVNGIKYTYEEFIESTEELNKISNIKIMNNVIKYMTQLYYIECKKKYKNVIWNTNSEFLRAQIDNLKQVLIKKNPSKLKMYLNEIENLYKEVDNNRKLCFIHGDIHRKNMIINESNFYLIDWELATYGDLAYEVATHFILMEYNELEKEYFIDNLCKNFTIDIEKFKSDINVYNDFEMYRRYILKEIKK